MPDLNFILIFDRNDVFHHFHISPHFYPLFSVFLEKHYFAVTLKATVAEDMYWCDVSIHNLSSKTPLYIPGTHLLSICSSAPFEKKSPWHMAYRARHMLFVMGVEIFSYLWNLELVPSTSRIGFLVWSLSLHFGSMQSTRFVRDCNVVLALLGEDLPLPDDFVIAASTTSVGMSLLFNRHQDEEEQHKTPLYHTTVMFDGWCAAAEDSTEVCFYFSFCRCAPILMPLQRYSK